MEVLDTSLAQSKHKIQQMYNTMFWSLVIMI